MEEQTAAPVSNFTFHFDPHPEHYCILNTSDDAFLLDARLSPATIYVMTIIRTLQSGKWEFSVEGLAKYTRRGVKLIRSALRELEEYGYYISEMLREGGKYAAKQYSFFDVPCRDTTESGDTSPLAASRSAVERSAVSGSAVERSAVKSTQPNIKHTFYQNKPKKERPKSPPSESRLTFSLDDIIEMPSPEWLEEHRSGGE